MFALVAGLIVGMPATAGAVTPPPATCVVSNGAPPAAPTSPVPGFVMWSPFLPGHGPNLLVGYLGQTFNDVLNCSSLTLDAPWYVAVAPGAALLLGGFDTTTNQSDALFAPWGAVSTTSVVNVPQDMSPGGQAAAWGGTTSVTAIDPAVLAAGYGACPSCDISHSPLPGDPPALGLPGGVPGVPVPTGWNSDGAVVANVGNFIGATMPAALVDGNIEGYRFDGASFAGSTIIAFASQTSFRRLTSAVGATFLDTNADHAHFDGADLSGASFNGADITSSQFPDVTVNATIFGNADITSATFQLRPFHTPPSFAGVVLDNTETVQDTCVSFVDSPLFGVSFAGVTWAPNCVGPMFPGSELSLLGLKQLVLDQKLTGIDFTGATVVASAADRDLLAGQDLTGADLAGVDVVGEPLDLTGTKLDGANLAGTNLSLATLAGASLTNVSAPGASFEGANLTGGDNTPPANFSGSKTNLQKADFTGADVSGASFVGANLSGAVFAQVRAVDTDFTGVTAIDAVFTGAHLYGNGSAFDKATDLTGVDFADAVLAGDITENGGFDFSGANLPQSHFDGAQCVGCDFTDATLSNSTFSGAYLPGVRLDGATVSNVVFDNAWLYCGSLTNDWCPSVAGQPRQWSWPLALSTDEVYGPVPFGPTLLPTSLADVATCPDGKAGATPTAGCAQSELLPSANGQPVLPASCSPSAAGACPVGGVTLDRSAAPLAVAPAVPATWNTQVQTVGSYAGFADSTIRLVAQNSPPTVIAGSPGRTCPSPTSACGDGGPATSALLGRPSALAVGLDGSLYISDMSLKRVRKVSPSGTITTVAGNGGPCGATSCGDGGQATNAALTAVNGVCVDVTGAVLIADGSAGVRRVAPDGLLTTLAPGSATGSVVSVVSAADGTVYAAAHDPDYIIAVDPATKEVTQVVGTGISGYNSNSGGPLGLLLPGTQVQINEPNGLSVDRGGNVLFADTGNSLIRAYVPSTTNVIDDLAGTIVNETPQSGDGADGLSPVATALQGPVAVAATGSSLRLVADTGNTRLRQLGPPPQQSDQAPAPHAPVLLSCRPGAHWRCVRLPAPPHPAPLKHGPVMTISIDGLVIAEGQWLRPARGTLRLLVRETRPIVPGGYLLSIGDGRHVRHVRLDVVARQ